MKYEHKKVSLSCNNEVISLYCFLDILEQIRATENIIKVRDQLPDLEPIHRCVACLSLKRYVAFLPCGHLVTCISCSDRVDTCPVCRGPKEAVVLVL